VPEIQEMLEKLPVPAPGTKCHERLGWLPSGMDDRCREIINKLITEVLKQENVLIPCTFHCIDPVNLKNWRNVFSSEYLSICMGVEFSISF
jgi:hypothetical protein